MNGCPNCNSEYIGKISEKFWYIQRLPHKFRAGVPSATQRRRADLYGTYLCRVVQNELKEYGTSSLCWIVYEMWPVLWESRGWPSSNIYIHYGEAILTVVPSDRWRALLASEKPHSLKILLVRMVNIMLLFIKLSCCHSKMGPFTHQKRTLPIGWWVLFFKPRIASP